MTSPVPPSAGRVIELPVRGMDCSECTQHVQHALSAVPGVESVSVFLSSEKAVLRLDPGLVKIEALYQAVEAAGYSVPGAAAAQEASSSRLSRFTRPVLTLFGLLVGAVLLIVVAGEWLGLFERVTDVVPWPVGWGLVLQDCAFSVIGSARGSDACCGPSARGAIHLRREQRKQRCLSVQRRPIRRAHAEEPGHGRGGHQPVRRARRGAHA